LLTPHPEEPRSGVSKGEEPRSGVSKGEEPRSGIDLGCFEISMLEDYH